MKSKAIIIFVIISSILSGFSSINNNTVGLSPNEDKKAEYSTAPKITQTTTSTPGQTIEPTQVPTIEPAISPAAESAINNSPEKTTDKINPDYLINPGVSLGKIKLNMKAKEVYKIFGIPSKKDSESITYYSKNKKNYIKIYLKKNKVSEIIFTSPSYETIDGDKIDTDKNVKLNIKQYNAWKFQWSLMQIRYSLKNGGLTFYTFNVDSEDDTEHPRNSIGILHKGKNPKYTPIEDAEWEKWDGDLTNLFK
jgi:hypothetical protein